VLGAFVTHLEQLLGEARSFQERVHIADQRLLRYAVKAAAFDRISSAANHILRAAGNTRVATLARDAGLSVRQFERCFMKQVGVHPKLYARIVRFEAALDSKARASTKSSDVACEFGYFDQMHMIHDFKSFSRGTPTDTLAEVEALFRDQIKAIRSGHPSVTAGDDLELIL
jgi:transcriptional regulator GlxA family with amidase domain